MNAPVSINTLLRTLYLGKYPEVCDKFELSDALYADAFQAIASNLGINTERMNTACGVIAPDLLQTGYSERGFRSFIRGLIIVEGAVLSAIPVPDISQPPRWNISGSDQQPRQRYRRNVSDAGSGNSTRVVPIQNNSGSRGQLRSKR